MEVAQRTWSDMQTQQTRVNLYAFEYLVDFGPGVQPRYHRVNKQKKCSCGMETCSAIEQVREYLREGGQRAPDPMPACPICGGKTIRCKEWDGKYTREMGWRCEDGGISHFLKAKLERIYRNWQENPWIIPPADGYPGVRRDEILTADDLKEVNAKALAEGYDPTA